MMNPLFPPLDKTVSFLDVLLKNKQGVLATSVYYTEAAEPYISYHLVKKSEFHA